jgi:hypothetical protein
MENKAVCTICSEHKTKKFLKNSGGRGVYVDGRGKKWNRGWCPTCSYKKRVQYESNRSQKEDLVVGKRGLIYLGDNRYIDPKEKMRPCNRCGDKTVNYYHCVSCIKLMSSNGSAGICEANYFTMYGVR